MNAGLQPRPVLASTRGRGPETGSERRLGTIANGTPATRSGNRSPGPGTAGLALTGGQRTDLQVAVDSGFISPPAAAILQKALDGKPLTKPEIKILEAERDYNASLKNSVIRADFSAVISEERQRLSQQASAATGGGNPGPVPPAPGGGGRRIDRLVAGLSALAALAGGGGAGGGESGGPAEGPVYAPAVSGETGVPTPDPVAVPPPESAPPVSSGAEVGGTGGGPEYGIKIVQVIDGGAAQAADLRADDILYSVGGQRVRDYDEFRAAVLAGRGAVEVVFWNAEARRLERLSVTPQDGLFGAVVVAAELPN